MIKFFLSLIIISLSLTVASAQPAYNAEKRLQQIKKMKMLDALELDEKTADKFLIKYNVWEDKLEEAHNQFRIASKELRMALNNDAELDVIKDKTNKYIEAQEKMHSLHIQKTEEFRSVLSEKEFAKYILFEFGFNRRIKELMIEGGRKRRYQQPLD